MPAVGDVIADKYKVEQLIGVGGMGAVFSALHQFTGKRVALKWMLPELAKDADAVARFLREAHAAGRISHPNVVDVYDVGQHAGSYFLVMEFLRGEPLTSALARRDLRPIDVLSLLLPAMRGVAAAHRQGVVHRDLKPDNIFLAYDEDGLRRDAKVLDFGISKLSNEEHPSMRLTKTGAVVGTPYYMSPEQIRGLAQLDKRADVYAFGVILYEALTGRVPFEADTYGALVLEIATGTPAAPHALVPALPAELSRVVLRAMARDMNERYPAMEHLIGALEPFTSAGEWGEPRERRNTGATTPNPGTVDAHTLLQTAAAPPVSVKAQRASTPFASELQSDTRPSRKGALGMASFGAAAAALVTGIWFFTREPAAPSAQVPALPEPSAKTQAPVHAAQLTPEDPTDPTALPPGPGAQAAQPIELNPDDPASQAAMADDFEPSDSNVNNRREAARDQRAHGSIVKKPAAREPKPRAQKRDGQSDSSLAPKPREATQPQHRARSGSLNVNEF